MKAPPKPNTDGNVEINKIHQKPTTAKRHTRFIISIIVLAIAFTILGSTVYGMYYFQREMNYKLFYQAKVKQEIRDAVKPEALKDSTAHQ